MIDTVILLLGFACAAIVFTLCAAEYSFIGRQNHIFYSLRKILPSPARMHSVILSIVCICAVASTLVSNQLGPGGSEMAAVQSGASAAPSTGSLGITK